MNYFSFLSGSYMTNDKFNKLFGGLPRSPEDDLTQREMDLAASIQKVTEEIVVKMANNIAESTKEKNLCLAGGVALNCVINGILSEKKIFENIWIQPAAGDAGGAIGAALALWHIDQKNPRNINNEDDMSGSYLGPEYSQTEIEMELKRLGARFKILDQLIGLLLGFPSCH